MVYNSILRMIEAVRNNDVEKFLKYIQPYLPDDEKEIGEKLIRESFSEHHVETTMDSSDEAQDLKDRLDTLYMNYLSQVSLWKSRYEDLLDKMKKRTKCNMGDTILEEYIKKVVSKIIKETIENNNKKVKVEDYWDLHSFTDEMLQHLNVDLSIFLCGKGYCSPIRYRNNKVKVSEQIERTTYPYEEVKKILERDLKFESWQVIEQQGSNDMKVILLLTDIGKNIDIVISKMKTLGWFNAEMSDVSLYNGIPIIAITFDPMYQSSVTDNVRKWKYLFHVSPAYNKESIAQHGLIPLSQNSTFNYPPRIYLVKPTIPQIVMQDFVGELCYNNRNPKNNGIYSLYQIDVDKIPDDIEFYLDPRFEDGIFTDNPIPNSAVKWLYDIDVRKFVE